MNDDKKNDAAVLAGQQTSLNSTNSSIGDNSITCVDNDCQVPKITVNSDCQKPKSTGRPAKVKKIVKRDAKLYSVAIKCYIEQMPNGLDYVKQRVAALDKKAYHAIGIEHNRDLVEDGPFWEVSIVKPHIHIIIRAANRKSRFHLDTMLRNLGIQYREGIDDDLWANHGVETVGNFAGYGVYLTHETPDAIAAGKEKYEVTELFSNLTLEEVEQVRAGYNRLTAGATKVTTEDLMELDKAAYELGYNMGNFEEWYDSQSFLIRSNVRMRTIRESYTRGVEARLVDPKANEVNRLCVFIRGLPNTGKTFASSSALSGQTVYRVRGGGTGKFDKLRVDHDAILVDDETVPNLLTMCDNYLCHVYKRNSNNPVWSGRYFVVTSNLPFDMWLESCGLKVRSHCVAGTQYYTKHYYAMLSRFYVCDVVTDDTGVSRLVCRSAADRGTVDEQKERLSLFVDFQEKFNTTIAGYTPSVNKVDYSSVVEASV